MASTPVTREVTTMNEPATMAHVEKPMNRRVMEETR
jgi:hypothetical protein